MCRRLMATGYADTHSMEDVSWYREIYEHPHWQGDKDTVELTKHPYAIVKEKSSPNRFHLLWMNKQGNKMAASFWAVETPTFQWCFENGQSHTFDRLDALIADVFNHFTGEDV